MEVTSNRCAASSDLYGEMRPHVRRSLWCRGACRSSAASADSLRTEVSMRKRSILLVAGALALVGSLVLGPAATAKPARQAAGTVVIGADQEPAILNIYLTAGNYYTTAVAINPVLDEGTNDNQKTTMRP